MITTAQMYWLTKLDDILATEWLDEPRPKKEAK